MLVNVSLLHIIRNSLDVKCADERLYPRRMKVEELLLKVTEMHDRVHVRMAIYTSIRVSKNTKRGKK